MPPKKKIQYDSAVGNLMKKCFPNQRLDQTGRETLTTLLNEVHYAIVKNFSKPVDDKKSDDAMMQHILKAIDKSLTGDLKKSAIVEGSRQLTLYQNGVLKYDPEKSIKKLQLSETNQRKRSMKSDSKFDLTYRKFKPGLSRLFSNLNSDLTMESSAKELLSIELYKLAERIAEKACNIAGDKPVLEPNDARTALESFLGSDILYHAKMEGNRSLALHARGIEVFKPRKPTRAVSADIGAGKSKMKPLDERFSPDMFRAGIRKMLPESCKLTKKPIVSMENIIYDLATVLSTKSAEMARSAGVEEIGFQEINDAVNQIFPKNLLEHALLSGNICLEHFKKGNLKYKRVPVPPPKEDNLVPKRKLKELKVGPAKGATKKRKAVSKPTTKRKTLSSGKKRKKSPLKKKENIKPKRTIKSRPKVNKIETKKKKTPKPNFTDGVLSLLIKLDPVRNVSATNDATDKIDDCLRNIFTALTFEVASSSKPIISAKSLRDAVCKIFPCEMARLANASAACSLAKSTLPDGGNSSELPLEDSRRTTEASSDIRGVIQSAAAETVKPLSTIASTINDLIGLDSVGAKVSESQSSQKEGIEKRILDQSNESSKNVQVKEPTETIESEEGKHIKPKVEPIEPQVEEPMETEVEESTEHEAEPTEHEVKEPTEQEIPIEPQVEEPMETEVEESTEHEVEPTEHEVKEPTEHEIEKSTQPKEQNDTVD